MALDCGFNITGLASNTVKGFFVMNIITFTFLLLCLVPFQVQLVTGCDKLCKMHTLKFFTGVFYEDTVILLHYSASPLTLNPFQYILEFGTTH